MIRTRRAANLSGGIAVCRTPGTVLRTLAGNITGRVPVPFNRYF